MKKSVILFVLMLLTLSMAAQQNPQLAEAAWVEAEKAYDAGRYEEALRHLDRTQEYAGQWLPTISHLRIVCYYKLKQNDNLAAEVRRYMDYADSNSNSVGYDRDKYREVYDISQMIGQPDYNEGQRLYNAKDYAGAIEWFNKATNKGHVEAMYRLGFMYEFGQGVAENNIQAAEWYRKAIDKGNYEAMYRLGVLYYEVNNYEQAFVYLNKAAEYNYMQALNSLGVMYSNGRGVTRDDAKALELYRKAADRGLPVAMYNVGYMYANGRGVTQDRNEAIKWMRMSADKGYNNAKEWLSKNAR